MGFQPQHPKRHDYAGDVVPTRVCSGNVIAWRRCAPIVDAGGWKYAPFHRSRHCLCRNDYRTTKELTRGCEEKVGSGIVYVERMGYEPERQMDKIGCVNSRGDETIARAEDDILMDMRGR